MGDTLRNLVVALGAIALAACEDKPAPSAAVRSASPPASTPSTEAPPGASIEHHASAEPPRATPPKPKRRAEDCPKGPGVEVTQKDLEAEIRRKLPKPSGALSVADLAKLRSINVSQVNLPELDVCVFGHMTALKELFLGPGDYDDLSPLGQSAQLESLRASINAVQDLTPLTKMSRLDRLDLGRTQVSDLKPLALLKKLTELELDDTPVEDIAPLATLTNLETLSLKRTRVKDASALAPLKKLKFLYVAGSPAGSDISATAAVRANGTKVIGD